MDVHVVSEHPRLNQQVVKALLVVFANCYRTYVWTDGRSLRLIQITIILMIHFKLIT